MNNLLEIGANHDFLFQSCCIHIFLVKMFVTTALRNLLQFGMVKKIFAKYYVQEKCFYFCGDSYEYDEKHFKVITEIMGAQ